jgi:hypothetical protein
MGKRAIHIDCADVFLQVKARLQHLLLTVARQGAIHHNAVHRTACIRRNTIALRD